MAAPTAPVPASVIDEENRKSQEISKVAHIPAEATKWPKALAHLSIGDLRSGYRSLMVRIEVNRLWSAVSVYRHKTY